MRAPSVSDGARPPVVVSKGCRGWWGCRCERRAEGCVRATRSASAPSRSLAMQAACVGESDRPLLFHSPPTGQPLATQSASSSPTAKRGTLGFSTLHFCFSEKGPRVPHLHPDPSAVHGVWAGAPRGAPLNPRVLLCTQREAPPIPQPSIRLPASQPPSSSDVLCHPASCPQPPGSRHSLACQSSPLPAHTLSTPGYPRSQLPVILSPPETSHFHVCHASLQFPTTRHKRDVLVIILPRHCLWFLSEFSAVALSPLLPPLSPSSSLGHGWTSLSIRNSSC